MALFRLIKGSFCTGTGPERKRYNHANPEANVVESNENLAAVHPGKFERLDEYAYERGGDPDYDRPTAQGTPQRGPQVHPTARAKTPAPASAATTMPPLTPTTAKAVNPSARDLEERYGSKLEDLTVPELREIAEAEEIPVPKSPPASKADLIAALKAGATAK